LTSRPREQHDVPFQAREWSTRRSANKLAAWRGPTSRESAATRRRLIEAARVEFAARGSAGARIDRIAAAAKANKAQIYRYFGSKEQLFDSQPDDRRLSTWRRLERGAPYPPLEGIVSENQRRLAAIAEAQRCGRLPDHFSPVELVTLVVTIAGMWTAQNPELTAAALKITRARRRQVVKDAVRAILGA
jgi:AcrR family transcriptional regulator